MRHVAIQLLRKTASSAALTARMLVHNAGEGTLSLLFPAHCALCQTPLAAPHELLCQPCALGVRMTGDSYCRRCGASLGAHVGIAGICPHCEGVSEGFGVETVVAAGPYEGSLRELILAMKFGRNAALARPCAAWLAQLVIDRGVECDLVTAVPLGRRREWQRGYNQAADVARHLARMIGKPFAKGLLRRARETSPQAQLPVELRARNVAGAFKPGRGAAGAKGRRILLVDDVLTTGATLREAARTLKRMKAKAVTAAVIGRAQ